MKLLLTADLHSCAAWYKWIAGRAREVDLVAVAGDLVKGFSNPFPSRDLRAAERFLGSLVEQGCPVAFCSGNHELFLGKSVLVPSNPALSLLRHRLLLPMGEPRIHPLFIPDGITRVVTKGEKGLVVTTIPHASEGAPERVPPTLALWTEGQRLRKETGYRWLVLHHEPPRRTRVGGIYGHYGVVDRIAQYQPDFVLSGHLHQQPYRRGGGFSDRIGDTLCLNAGQVPPGRSSIPNHIVLETQSGEIKWVRLPDNPYGS